MSDNIQVLDATANSVTLRSTDSAGAHLPHHIVESSALPTGAATEASLASVLAKIIAAPATEATSASLLASIGAPADAAWVSGSGSVIAILKTIATNTTP